MRLPPDERPVALVAYDRDPSAGTLVVAEPTSDVADRLRTLLTALDVDEGDLVDSEDLAAGEAALHRSERQFNEELFTNLRARGLRRRAARILREAAGKSRGTAERSEAAARSVIADLRKVAEDVEERVANRERSPRSSSARQTGDAKKRQAVERGEEVRGSRGSTRKGAVSRKATSPRAKTTASRAKNVTSRAKTAPSGTKSGSAKTKSTSSQAKGAPKQASKSRAAKSPNRRAS